MRKFVVAACTVLLFVPLWAVACVPAGTLFPDTDAGTEECRVDRDCVGYSTGNGGKVCAYLASQGCQAVGRCVTSLEIQCGASMQVCGCDGKLTYDLAGCRYPDGYSEVPYDHSGSTAACHQDGPDSSIPIVDGSIPIVDGSTPIVDGGHVDGATEHPDAHVDAGVDSSSEVDTGVPGTCAPADVSTFHPAWKAPKAHADSCTQTQIDTYLTACLGTQSTAATCAPFQFGAGLKCAQCIESRDTDPTLGPMVSHGGFVTGNTAGCVSLATNDLAGVGCAGKLLDVDQCSTAACSANCPVTDDASLMALDACTDTAKATGGGCATYEIAAKCGDGLEEAGGAAAVCLSGQTFEDTYKAIVPIFCLTGTGGSFDAAGGG